MAARIVPPTRLPKDLHVVSMSDFKKHFERYVRSARRAPILLTHRGRPALLLTDMSIYDMEDIGYMRDPKFWKMIERRRKGPTVPFDEVKRRLDRIAPRKRSPSDPTDAELDAIAHTGWELTPKWVPNVDDPPPARR